jgi:hypothetical protein
VLVIQILDVGKGEDMLCRHDNKMVGVQCKLAADAAERGKNERNAEIT